MITPEQKKRMLNIFNNIKDNLVKKEIHEYNRNQDVLLVDCMNTFIRAFMASPNMNDNGMHIGGISGFLKSIGYAIKLLNPTRVICIFDGCSGSIARRKIYPEYKSGRRTRIKFNRTYSDIVDLNIENKNMTRELLRIIDYIKRLPVTIIVEDCYEADDIIAYLATDEFKDSRNVYIMSSDKDFYQLISNNIKVWSASKKKLYGISEIYSEFNIYPYNFILYKILLGDISDNIPGIKGCGLKRVLKAFPFLTENKKYTISDILTYSENNIGKKYKLYNDIVQNKTAIERNYALMQLNKTLIQSFIQLKIHNILEKQVPVIAHFELNRMIYEDMMQSSFINLTDWLNSTWGVLQINNQHNFKTKK